MLIGYRLQKECNLRKCQIDEVKAIQITNANLVVNVLFMQVIKFSVRGASKYRQIESQDKALVGQKLRGFD